MKDFMNKVKTALVQFMRGRHGPDELGLTLIFAGLILSMLGSATRLIYLTGLGFLLYVVTLLRMLSRNRQVRYQENQKYLSMAYDAKTKSIQFFRRLKNRKEYKYFKCPQCKALIRVKRGTGERLVTCPRCGYQFQKKS